MMTHELNRQIERVPVPRVGVPLLVFTLLTAMLLSAACSRARSDVAQVAASPIAASPVVPAPVNSGGGGAQNSYADVVARVAPAVVTIRSERRARAAQQHPFLDDPAFRDFFGGRTPQLRQAPPQVERGLGSGVIISADGTILTNHHVIDGAQDIKVELGDHRVLDAKVVGSDPPSDLAVLKIEATNLPVLPLGDSDKVRVGDVALAVGNPLGIGQTVTSGIISAKDRSTGLGDGSFADFLQTDAPINQGNSGGALVNTNGELIGINSQILSPSGGNIGIGFAVPSNMAKSVMEQLLKGGKVKRGQLGVQIQQVTSDIAQSLGLKDVRGVIVGAVTPGGAGERAGIKQGDVITALNGAPISDANGLRNRVASTAPNTEVTLTLVRDGREQQVKATLGEYTASGARGGGGSGDNGGDEENSGNGGDASAGKLGISVQPLTPDIAGQLKLRPGTQGLVVNEVDPEGPAADAGLQAGDVIVEINRQSVRSAADINAALQRAAGRPALLLVNRRGNTVFLTVRPKA